MYRDRIQQAIRRDRLLHTVLLELTYKCNLDCFYCYNDKAAAGTPLSFDQYVALFADLAKMQTLFLTFTGGEPMVHPRFFDLGRAAREHGFAVRLRTNGHTLTHKLAKRLVDTVDPCLVEMSLHGATAATHDRQTRVHGSFDQLVSNIRAMNELGLKQNLVCTPTAWNEKELESMFDLADGLGVRLRFQGPVGPRVNGDTEPLSIQPSGNAWESLSRIQKDRRKAAGQEGSVDTDIPGTRDRVCGIGTRGVDIDPFGNVYPCQQLKRSMGSLHSNSITEIWSGQAGRAVLNDAQQLSFDAAKRFDGKPVEQYGAPVFCPAVEINSGKACDGAACGGCSS